jgi:hypothetical protein
VQGIGRDAAGTGGGGGDTTGSFGGLKYVCYMYVCTYVEVCTEHWSTLHVNMKGNEERGLEGGGQRPDEKTT